MTGELQDKRVRILVATDPSATPTVVLAAPAWVDPRGAVRVAATVLSGDWTKAQSDDVAADLTMELAGGGELAVASIGAGDGSSPFTHCLTVTSPAWTRHRTWLVQIDNWPEDPEAAAAAGYEEDGCSVGFFRQTGPVH